MSEGKTYLASPDEYSNTNYCYVIYIMDKDLYDSIDQITLYEKIKWTKTPGFEDIIPKEYHLVKFKNFNAERFIEIIPKRTMGPKPQSAFEMDSHKLINADHTFMKCLAKVIPKIKEKAITPNLRTFFSLVIDPDRIHEALQIQMMILEELRRRKLVDHPSRFILREQDFPFISKKRGDLIFYP